MKKMLNIENIELQSKFLKLKGIIEGYKKVAIAYSGGIDSTLLALISHNILGQNALNITVNSEFYSKHELEEAIFFARQCNFRHEIIDISVINNTTVTENTPLRCKHCKEVIFSRLIERAKEENIDIICHGANLDDIHDYRPGLEAAKMLGVKSPFIDAGFTKQNIRELAKLFGLSNWSKPALACLASRVPYNTRITKDILNSVEEAENYIRELGYEGFRVRHHNDIARIEINLADIEKFMSNHRENVNSKLKSLGYNYVCIDLNGYKTGSLNTPILDSKKE